MLIALEGPDGAGKTTQGQLLIDRLKRGGKRVVGIKFPQYGSSLFGRLASQYLSGKFGDFDSVDPHLVSLIYAGDRWQAQKNIQQWLSNQTIVIADRYTGSNIAHQGARLPRHKQTEFMKWIEELEFTIYRITKPELTLYFQLSFIQANRLLDNRGIQKDILERNKVYMKKVHELYGHIAKKNQWQIIAIEEQGAILSPAEVHERVWQRVAKHLSI